LKTRSASDNVLADDVNPLRSHRSLLADCVRGDAKDARITGLFLQRHELMNPLDKADPAATKGRSEETATENR
jgi:hypothetical protein